MEEYVKLAFIHDAFEDESIETAWAIPKNQYFELDNLLFYAKDFALGDLIEAQKINGQLQAKRTIKESGNSLIRIFFEDLDFVQPTRKKLKSLMCDSEISNIPKLLSVNIPAKVDYSIIRDFLDAGEERGDWEYEEACLSSGYND